MIFFDVSGNDKNVTNLGYIKFLLKCEQTVNDYDVIKMQLRYNSDVSLLS